MLEDNIVPTASVHNALYSQVSYDLVPRWEPKNDAVKTRLY